MPMTRTRLRTADLSGRTVVVTGAGSGIGREIALLCAARGADLALCDISEAGLDSTARTARTCGVAVLAQRADVSDHDDVLAFAAATTESFGAVDLLVNNAGVGLVGGFLDTAVQDWHWLLSVNLMGVVHCCTAFLPGMVEQARGGHVVNIASAAGLLANAELSAYSATKFGVVGLSEALRVEMRPHGIGVTAVCPGLIDTGITRSAPIRGTGDAAARRERMAAVYRKRGYGPARVARNVLRAVDRDRAVAPIAAEAHLMYAASRMAPPVARWMSAQLAEASK